MTYKHEFQRQFWDYLEIKGLSLERLGQHLSATKGAVSKWVNGHTRYPKHALLKTCKIFFGDPESSRAQTFIALYEDFWQQKKGTAQKLPSKKKPDSSPPLQRLPRAPHFIGREAEIEQVLNDLQPGSVVTLCGPGGIGKTAIASEAIWRLTHDPAKPPEHFPDGIIFHNFYSQPQATLALEHIARTFGEEPRPTPALAAQRVLAGKRALLILDGVENTDDLDAILEIRGTCGVLVTSRRRSDAIAKRQDIGPLQPNEALSLLRAWGGVRARDEKAAREICTLVGDLPLAVRLIGRYLAQQEINAPDYLAWLQATPLTVLDQGQRQRESVPLLLERSLAHVSKQAHQILAITGVLALAPFPVDVITAILPPESSKLVFFLLGELINYGLLLRTNEQYAVSHTLIHTFASQQLKVSKTSVMKLATYFTVFAKQQLSLASPGYMQLDVVRPHIMAVLEAAMLRRAWHAVKELVWAIDTYLDLRGYWSIWLLTTQTGLRAARALADRREEGAFLGKLGLIYIALDHFEQAIDYFQQALHASRDAGHREYEGHWIGNLGIAYITLGQVEKAIDHFQESLQIARETGDLVSEGNMAGNLGSAYFLIDQIDKALEYSQQGVIVSREAGGRRGESAALANLGLAYERLGQREKAIDYLQQALHISCEIGDRDNEGAGYEDLGNVYFSLGQVEKARKLWQEALRVYTEIKSPKVETVRNLLERQQ